MRAKSLFVLVLVISLLALISLTVRPKAQIPEDPLIGEESPPETYQPFPSTPKIPQIDLDLDVISGRTSMGRLHANPGELIEAKLIVMTTPTTPDVVRFEPVLLIYMINDTEAMKSMPMPEEVWKLLGKSDPGAGTLSVSTPGTLPDVSGKIMVILDPPPDLTLRRGERTALNLTIRVSKNVMPGHYCLIFQYSFGTCTAEFHVDIYVEARES